MEGVWAELVQEKESGVSCKPRLTVLLTPENKREFLRFCFEIRRVANKLCSFLFYSITRRIASQVSSMSATRP